MELSDLSRTALIERVRVLEVENSSLRRESRVDALTGLANRRSVNEELARKTAEARRHGHPFAVLLLDIDHFKSINDTYGHDVGDAVLCRVARAVERSVREGDTAARWGGEEFAVVLPNTSQRQALAMAERVRCAVEALELPGVPDGVTVSVGVSGSPAPLDGIDVMLKRADTALYAAKDGGRNRVVQMFLDVAP